MNTKITKKTLKAKLLKLKNQFDQFLFCHKTYTEGQQIDIIQYYCQSSKKVWWEHELVRSTDYLGWAPVGFAMSTTINDKAILDRYFKIID